MNGARRWFREQGFDFRRMCREGVPVEEVEHIEDELIQRVIEIAKGDDRGRKE